MSLLSAQERLSTILLANVLDVPNVFLGALPYGSRQTGATQYPYLAILGIAGSWQLLSTRTASLRAIYGVTEDFAIPTMPEGTDGDDVPVSKSTPEQMGQYLGSLAEAAMGAVEACAGNLGLARVTSLSWSVESRITRPYWHLLLDFDIEMHARPACTNGYLT